jgi:hypothetical protein
MEKIILKTIREAFKIAYINKLIKEGSEELAKKLTQDQLRVAENMYNRWINGRLHLEFGKQDADVLNYIIEKGAEEYKQTKDTRLRDAIATVFRPISTGGGNAIYRTMMSGESMESRAFISNMKRRFGNRWKEEAEDAIANTFVKFIIDPKNFDRILDSYKGDTSKTGTGISSLFMQRFKTGAMGLSSGLAAQKRGGGDIDTGAKDTEDAYGGSIDTGPKTSSYDDPESGAFKKIGDDDSDSYEGPSDQSQAEFGKTGTPEEMFSSLADEFNYDSSKGNMLSSMGELFNGFADTVNDMAKDPKNRISEANRYLIVEYFKNKKTPTEIWQSRPELYPTVKNAGDMGTILTNGLKSGKFLLAAQKLGPEFGFPSNWLEKIMEQKKLKLVQQYLKDKGNDNGPDDSYTTPGPQGWSPLYEKKIEDNMDAIIKEVYKRLAQQNK